MRAECALRDHPTLKRWIRRQKNGRLVIDRAKVKAEARLDGKYLLATSDPDISAEDAALGYKNLLEAERGFRDMKSVLLLRPVFHRLEHRIRANRELGRLTQVTLTGPAGTIIQTTPITPAQNAIFKTLGIKAPDRVSAVEPA